MKKVVGICGLIGHGKDTAASFLIDEGFQRISFAGVLKDACASIFSWDREMLEGLTPEAREWRETVDAWWAKRLNMPNLTPRYALQYIGTNVFREHFHSDIWVAACERQIEMTDKDVVISDCRFFNELDVIKNYGGKTVVVWRNNKPDWWATASNVNINNLNFKSNNTMNIVFPEVHPSEWSWAGWDFDITLNNNSTLEEFKKNTLQELNV